MEENVRKDRRKTGKAAFIKSVPVLGTYVTLGIGFGVLLEKSGYGVLWALLMSIFIFAGTMQYMAVELLASGASLLLAALATVMVNGRHLFYGISMLDRYRDMKGAKPYLYFGLTDETYSLVCTDDVPEDVDKKLYYVLLTLLNQCYWVTGSVIGSLLGSAAIFDSTGIEFSMTALFVTVFLEQWLGTKRHIPALTGVTAAFVCLLLFGSSYFLIPAMAVTVLALALYRGKYTGKGGGK